MKWISVNTRMPEEAEWVIATDGESVFQCRLCRYETGDLWHKSVPMYDPTHWMPMPEPPNK